MIGAPLPILMYHAFDSSGSVIATDPAWFAETLDALASAGFRSVDLPTWIEQGRPPVDRAFALTFDDGLRSILQAADSLVRHGFSATAFLVTGRMGLDNAWQGQPRGIPRSPLLSWSDLSSLRAAGVRFGAHTRTHPRLDRLDERAVVEELRGSRDDLEQRLGEPCPLIAYPYGIAPARVRRVAVQHFSAGFSTRLDRAQPSEDPMRISRIDSYELRSPRSVRALIEGGSARFRLRRTMREGRRLLFNP